MRIFWPSRLIKCARIELCEQVKATSVAALLRAQSLWVCVSEYVCVYMCMCLPVFAYPCEQILPAHLANN